MTTPAETFMRIGRGIDWCFEQILFTHYGWGIIAAIVLGWCLLFAWAEGHNR